MPIDTAPKDREVLLWREDCGAFIGKHTCLSELMSDSEMEKENISDDEIDKEFWFGYYIHGGYILEGSELPTHWMPLPEGPKS